jgi:hypothetical protein
MLEAIWSIGRAFQLVKMPEMPFILLRSQVGLLPEQFDPKEAGEYSFFFNFAQGAGAGVFSNLQGATGHLPAGLRVIPVRKDQ